MEFSTFIICFLLYLIYKSLNKKNNSTDAANREPTIYELEQQASHYKDSMDEIDLWLRLSYIQVDQVNDLETMQTNYLRAKNRVTGDKSREVCLAWLDYTSAVLDIHKARVSDNLSAGGGDDGYADRVKEPKIKIEEVQRFFKEVLGDDFKPSPPKYSERLKTMRAPTEDEINRFAEENGTDVIDSDWRFYYRDCSNYKRLSKKESETS